MGDPCSRTASRRRRRRSSRRRAARRRKIAIVSLLGLAAAALIVTAFVRQQQLAVPATETVPAATTARATARPTVKPASLEAARAALRTASTVSVIGDSTGNDVGEWVTLWADHLGRRDRVEVHQWADADHKYLDSPLTYGEDGRRLAIWNAGKPGGSADWAAGQIAEVEPERPGLVILSVAHNNTEDDVAGQLDTVRRAITERWGDVPLVVILQNPGLGDQAERQAATLRAVRAWTLRNGVPAIDVESAFKNPRELMVDNAHPNAEGSRIWADVVSDALD